MSDYLLASALDSGCFYLDGERQQEVGLPEDSRPPLVVLHAGRGERQRRWLRANTFLEGKIVSFQYRENINFSFFHPIDSL